MQTYDADEVVHMMHNMKMLAAISSTEPSTFNEFLRSYDDTPERGDSSKWADLFHDLETLESQGLVEIERTNGRIDTLMLTAEGAQLVKNG